MSQLITTTISGLGSTTTFVVLESSLVQSNLPVLRAFVRSAKSNLLLFSFLYPPSSLVQEQGEGVQIIIIDLTAQVPGYTDTFDNDDKFILKTVKQVPDGPLTVVIDSGDVLCADLESPSKAYGVIASLLSHLSARPKPSGLVVHFSGTSPLCDLILTPRLSPNLVHIIAHPPGLLQHLATTQLIPPPPASAPDLFWRVFTPLTGRRWEVEGILLGSGGQGPTEDESIVLEIVNRTLNRKTIKIDKFLEAWNRDLPCSLSQLDILKPFLLQKLSSSSSSSFTFNTFNLNLTPEQWISRAKVPLPYAHKGSSSGSGAIMYEPDSADDIDDDDPDEDLNI